MSPATITAAPSTKGGTSNTENTPQVAPQTPFVRASFEHHQQFFDLNVPISASETVVGGGPIDVPAYGYMRSILITAVCLGGTGTVAVAKEDAPWSAIAGVKLSDVNGAPLTMLSGFDLYLANKFGGYQFNANPTTLTTWSAMSTAGTFAFAIRIPVEIGRREGLGALPNTNSGQQFKLELRQAPSASIYATPPTGSPAIQWTGYIEAWAQPASMGEGGTINATRPPGEGTTQHWTSTTKTLGAGQFREKLPRVGHLIRNLFIVFRPTSTGLRATGGGLSNWQLLWDDHVVFSTSNLVINHYVSERFGYAPDAGCQLLTFTHDFTGHPGDAEMRDLWLPTGQATKLEIAGSLAAAGTLTIITNDVAASGQIHL